MAYEWEGWKFDSAVAATIPLCEGEVLRDTVWNPTNSKDDVDVRGLRREGICKGTSNVRKSSLLTG